MSIYRFSLDVPVENRWDNVEQVRNAVQGCFAAVFRDVNGRHAVAMVTGELLENAMKYGDWSRGHGVFRLRVWGDHTRSAVAVTNPVAAGSGGPERVSEVLRFIAAQPTPLHAYQAKLVEVASRRSQGGLGLVRVAYEGKCNLSVGLVDDELTVTAEREQPLVLDADAGSRMQA